MKELKITFKMQSVRQQSGGKDAFLSLLDSKTKLHSVFRQIKYHY